MTEPCDTPEKELHARGECDFGCVYCEAEADDRREAEMPRTRLEWIEATYDENDHPNRGHPE